MTQDPQVKLIARIEKFEDAVLAPWVKDALMALTAELPPAGLQQLAGRLDDLESQLARLGAERQQRLLEVFAKELKRQQAARR